MSYRFLANIIVLFAFLAPSTANAMGSGVSAANGAAQAITRGYQFGLRTAPRWSPPVSRFLQQPAPGAYGHAARRGYQDIRRYRPPPLHFQQVVPPQYRPGFSPYIRRQRIW